MNKSFTDSPITDSRIKRSLLLQQTTNGFCFMSSDRKNGGQHNRPIHQSGVRRSLNIEQSRKNQQTYSRQTCQGGQLGRPQKSKIIGWENDTHSKSKSTNILRHNQNERIYQKAIFTIRPNRRVKQHNVPVKRFSERISRVPDSQQELKPTQLSYLRHYAETIDSSPIKQCQQVIHNYHNCNNFINTNNSNRITSMPQIKLGRVVSSKLKSIQRNNQPEKCNLVPLAMPHPSIQSANTQNETSMTKKASYISYSNFKEKVAMMLRNKQSCNNQNKDLQSTNLVNKHNNQNQIDQTVSAFHEKRKASYGARSGKIRVPKPTNNFLATKDMLIITNEQIVTFGKANSSKVFGLRG